MVDRLANMYRNESMLLSYTTPAKRIRAFLMAAGERTRQHMDGLFAHFRFRRKQMYPMRLPLLMSCLHGIPLPQSLACSLKVFQSHLQSSRLRQMSFPFCMRITKDTPKLQKPSAHSPPWITTLCITSYWRRWCDIWNSRSLWEQISDGGGCNFVSLLPSFKFSSRFCCTFVIRFYSYSKYGLPMLLLSDVLLAAGDDRLTKWCLFESLSAHWWVPQAYRKSETDCWRPKQTNKQTIGNTIGN